VTDFSSRAARTSLPLPFKSHHSYKAKRIYHKGISFLLGADDGISARGGLADKQSTGLFGPFVRFALSDKLLSQFSPYQIPSRKSKNTP
jgi:hypothetical protein